MDIWSHLHTNLECKGRRGKIKQQNPTTCDFLESEWRVQSTENSLRQTENTKHGPIKIIKNVGPINIIKQVGIMGEVVTRAESQ